MPEGKRLSNLSVNVTNSEFILQDDVISNVGGCKDCESNEESEELASERGDFLETDHLPVDLDTVQGQLRKHLHAWEELEATKLRTGYKLSLPTIHPSVLLKSNKSDLHNYCAFISECVLFSFIRFGENSAPAHTTCTY